MNIDLGCNHTEVEYISRSVSPSFYYRCLQCNKLGQSSLMTYRFDRLQWDKINNDRFPVYVRRERRN